MILRDETEWVELVHHQFAALVGADTELINKAFQKRNQFSKDFDKPLFGEYVSDNIYAQLTNFLGC